MSQTQFLWSIILKEFHRCKIIKSHQQVLKFRFQIQKQSVSPKVENFPPQEVANFYQTGGLPDSLSNDYDTVSNLEPQSSSEDKYAEVKSLVYENTVGIVGKEKGSGKTSKLGYLIAEHIKLGHLVWMINPFAFMSAVERY